MIVALVQFQMPDDTTVADAAAIFRSTAPRYLGMPDLVRKYYVFDPKSRRAGGCYLMRDRAAAERVFDESWRRVVAEKYGAPPEVTFFEAPVTVDNVTHEISIATDAAQRADGALTLAHTLVGEGPEHVVVLHDWTSTSASYAALHDLVDRGRFTYCFMDHRGYGQSRGISGKHTSREAARDVVALADALGWDRFHLVGHSMSGQVAQRVTLDFPGRVKSLVAVTPVPACGVPIDDASREMFVGAAQSEENWKSIAKMLTEGRLGETWYNAKFASFRQTIDPAAFLGFLDMWTREDFAPELGAVDMPALVVTGGHDMEVFREESLRNLVGRHYPNAKFETLADSGHYPMAEVPIRFVKVIEEFIGAQSSER